LAKRKHFEKLERKDKQNKNKVGERNKKTHVQSEQDSDSLS
jgi:hypothetical protein